MRVRTVQCAGALVNSVASLPHTSVEKCAGVVTLLTLGDKARDPICRSFYPDLCTTSSLYNF